MTTEDQGMHMAGNRGRTSLKCRKRAENPMQEFDRLPPHLRSWVAGAMLPWRARSVRRAYEQALARTGDPARALADLDALQARLVERDAQNLWGPNHPQVSG